MDKSIKSPATVQSLRQSGHKVRVIHSRLVSNYHVGKGLIKKYKYLLVPQKNIGDSSLIEPRGGETRVEITTPEGKNLFGVAKCSLKDSYNRHLGLNLAINRAFSEDCV